MDAPAQLLRKEVIHPRQPDQLRQRARQPKRIRQPRRLASYAEAGLEEALAKDHLAGEGFAGGHVCVCGVNDVSRKMGSQGPSVRADKNMEGEKEED